MSADDGLIDLAEHQPAVDNDTKTVLLPGPVDDLAATVALAESGLFDDYVSYQGHGVRWFAGNTRASVVVDHRLQLRHTPRRGEGLTLGTRPVRQVGAAVGQMLRPGQRAFGYLTFDLAHPDAGGAAVCAPLAHFMVPQVEVCWSSAGVQITSYDEALLDAVADIVLSATPCGLPTATPVELHPAGDRDVYEDRVAATVAAIRQQLLAKAIISRRVAVPYPVDLPRSYVLGLRNNNPARSYLMQLGDRRCAGFSPEILAAV